MAPKNKVVAQNPLLLRCNRLMEAFAKSDDERDFFIDRQEGFLIYVDLDKPEDQLNEVEKEILKWEDRFILIPKMTFYETKKIMEGFVNEKVYDIDTKEKLLDIIQSKDARDNFLEFIFDHHNELEKWQSYYQERSRVRIIEWLRINHFQFVFEEDLDLPRAIMEKVKQQLFDPKPSKEVVVARKTLEAKSKTYYSTEALNPRPKRGRPPKQAVKQEIEPQFTVDIFTTVPAPMRPFLFTPDIAGITAATFSSKFESEEALLANRRNPTLESNLSLESINQKLASLRTLASKWVDVDQPASAPAKKLASVGLSFDEIDLDDVSDDEEIDDLELSEEDIFDIPVKKTTINGKTPVASKNSPVRPALTKTVAPKAKAPVKPIAKVPPKPLPKKAVPAPKAKAPVVTAKAKVAPKAKAPVKKAAPVRKPVAPPKKKPVVAAKKAPVKAPSKSKFRPMKKLKAKK